MLYISNVPILKVRTRIFNLHQAYYFTIQEKGGATVKHQVKMTVIDKKLFPEL